MQAVHIKLWEGIQENDEVNLDDSHYHSEWIRTI